MQNVHIQKAGLEIRLIENLVGFENLREKWTYLFNNTNCNEAFLTWEWLFVWWKNHKNGKQLWLVTVWENENLKGVAPLMLIKVKKYGLDFRVITNLGNPDTDVSSFIVYDEDADRVVEAIFEFLRVRLESWDLINIFDLPAAGAVATALVSKSEKRGCTTLKNKESHFYLPINSDWAWYYTQLPHSLQGYLHHHLEKANKKGALRFEVYSGEKLTWEHFQTIFEINKNGKFPHLYQSEAEYQFMRELFELTQGQNWIEIDILYFNDQPIAFNYGFNMAGRHEGWRMAYDSSFKKLGFGKILSMNIMKSFFTRGFREFDFLRGLEEYKREWLPQERGYMELRIVPHTKFLSAITFVWLPKLHTWMNTIFKRKPQVIELEKQKTGL